MTDSTDEITLNGLRYRRTWTLQWAWAPWYRLTVERLDS